MKVTYWYAELKDDSNVYSIRTRTKREAVQLRNEEPDRYRPVVKVVVEYATAFQLLEYLSGESAGYEEMVATEAALKKLCEKQGLDSSEPWRMDAEDRIKY